MLPEAPVTATRMVFFHVCVRAGSSCTQEGGRRGAPGAGGPPRPALANHLSSPPAGSLARPPAPALTFATSYDSLKTPNGLAPWEGAAEAGSFVVTAVLCALTTSTRLPWQAVRLAPAQSPQGRVNGGPCASNPHARDRGHPARPTCHPVTPLLQLHDQVVWTGIGKNATARPGGGEVQPASCRQLRARITRKLACCAWLCFALAQTPHPGRWSLISPAQPTNAGSRAGVRALRSGDASLKHAGRLT